MKFLRPANSNVAPSRRRVRSEYDGDYDLDKRWEIHPFNATTKAYSVAPHVTVTANLAVSSNYKAKQINDYGAMVWAIIQLLESKGIRVTVNATYGSDNDEGDIKTLIRVTVKEPIKYISPQSLANVFRSVFIRRVFHNAIILACDSQNRYVGGGLGRPINPPTSVQYFNGELTLDIGALNDYSAIETGLAQAMKGTK